MSEEHREEILTQRRTDVKDAMTADSKFGCPRQNDFWGFELEGQLDFSRIGSHDVCALRGSALFATTSHPQPDTLIIGVTGAAGALAIPISRFIESFSSFNSDIIILYDRDKVLYRNGISPFGSDLISTTRNMKKRLQIDRYKRVSVISSSIGASAALSIAHNVQAQRLVMMAPILREVNDRIFLRILCNTRISFNPFCHCSEALPRNSVALFSSGLKVDCEMADALLEAGINEVFPFKSNNHNFFTELIKLNSGLDSILLKAISNYLASSDNQSLQHLREHWQYVTRELEEAN